MGKNLLLNFFIYTIHVLDNENYEEVSHMTNM